MIKVQPARSRIQKDESPDRLSLTMPPKGFGSLGGAAVPLAAVWVAAALGWVVWAHRVRAWEWEIAAAVVALSGVVAGLMALAACRSSWTLERTADGLVQTRRGLWRTSVRSWPAADLSSFWVEEAPKGLEVRSMLILGFRNGRSHELLYSSFPEELRWLAAMLSDPRGSRRTVEPPGLVAEPVRRRGDPAAVPPTLSVRRSDSETRLDFRPLLASPGLWTKPLAAALAAATFVAGLARVLSVFTRSPLPAAAGGAVLAVLAGALLVRGWRLTRSATVELRNRILRITPRPLGAPIEFPVEDLEFVQTLRSGRHTELQFLIRGRPKIRVLEGRPPEELEWAARFLRLAIRGRPDQETRPMQVDPAAGDCQVCGEKMDRRVIFCAKCRTPHHEECWSYVGQCSTYGCREIGFTRT